MRHWALIIMLMSTPAFAQDWGSISVRDVGRDDDGVNWIGLEIQLAEGWKTYWEYAGQNGLDPEITLSQDGEEIESDIHWPMPHLFVADDLPSVGYKENLVVPIAFKGDGKIDIDVSMGVCETVCVPVQGTYDVNAQSGYSIEQYILKGTTVAPEAEACVRDLDALAALENDGYWMVIDERGGEIVQSFSERDAASYEAPVAIYALHEDEVEPLACS